MPLIARQRSRLAVLAVLALVGSLLAVSAVPAVAAGDEKVSAEAEFSACVAAATDDFGFPDVGSGEGADAANCLAHYGITVGTSDGNFAPLQSITRVQMARFLTRAAGPAGIEMEEAEDQDLIDIGHLGGNSQDAINQAVALGIMEELPNMDGVFDPGGVVDRKGMAVMLRGFVDAANGDDYYADTVDEEDRDEPFTDLGSVPFASYTSINELYELGIADGTGDGTTFSPDALVTRGQMAKFVTRALAHTNARPVGISIQGKTTGITTMTATVTLSVRGEDYQPVPDALIDLFSSSSPAEVLDDDGACVDKHTRGEENCKIDDADAVTEPDGNTSAEVSLPDDPGSITVWAWTGDIGDEFDADDNPTASLEIDAAKDSTQTLVTDDMNANATRLMFGDTVTYTLQIANEDGEPVAEEGLGVTVNAVMADPDRPDTRTTQSVEKTDAAGRIELSYSADDPDADDDNTGDRITLVLTLTPTTDNGVDGLTFKATDNDDNDDPIQVEWSDMDGVPSHLSLAQSVEYHETNDDGVRNTVSATLVDQYGDPVKNKKVTFWSDVTNTEDDTLGLGGSTVDTVGSADNPALPLRTTSRSGVATKSYSRNATPAANESVSAQFIRVNGPCADTDSDCISDLESGVSDVTDTTLSAMVTHRWSDRISGEADISGDVLVVDTDNNTIVIEVGGSPRLATYKAGDQFTVAGDGAVTMEVFEKALSVADATAEPARDADSITVTIGDDEDDTNVFNITDNN